MLLLGSDVNKKLSDICYSFAQEMKCACMCFNLKYHVFLML
jgi:hypothetical protein